MWSLCLVVSECSLSGRGQDHVSNYYIVDLENCHSKSSVYRWYPQLARGRFVYDTYRTLEATRSRDGWVHMFIPHCPTITLQLHNFDLFRTWTCCTSSFCSVAWHTHTHTHTHPFNSPLSGTTQVVRYLKGKTNLDFTEARDSEWQWHELGNMQVCTSLQTDNHASTPQLSFYRPDALPAAQPTASKHWRNKVLHGNWQDFNWHDASCGLRQ